MLIQQNRVAFYKASEATGAEFAEYFRSSRVFAESVAFSELFLPTICWQFVKSIVPRNTSPSLLLQATVTKAKNVPKRGN